MNYDLTSHEVQSGADRVRNAEELILQLPKDHDGRNTWLMNYGVGDEANALRYGRRLLFNPATRAAVPTRVAEVKQPNPAEAVTAGATHDAAHMAELVDKFNASQEFEPVRDLFPSTIAPYPKD